MNLSDTEMEQQKPAVVVSQPTGPTGSLLPQKERDWSSGLFDCWKDPLDAMFASCFFPCYNCKLAYEMDECVLGPMLCDYIFQGAMRTKVRTLHGIKGSILNDCCCSYLWCKFCSMTQLRRELKHINRENKVDEINDNGFEAQQQQQQTVVVTQPTVVKAGQQPKDLRDWSTGMFACCEEPLECLYAYFCFPCYTGKLASEMDECFCGPFLLDHGFMVPLRTKMRIQYGIKGSIMEDFCWLQWFRFCAFTQMYRELKIVS